MWQHIRQWSYPPKGRSSERQLLEQDSYPKKLAEGIAEAINGVYTNTQ